ncbi:protein kinase [Streptomyces sp. NPDC093111]|uniref:protein kinase n=1 Tax=Streptomyces sp. NPDC093111 TaxID=3154978 RepID=UPI00341320C8
MDEYAGRVLADRYRLPVPPADAYDLVETRAFDTYSGQEVRMRQVPLPEIVDAELVGDEPYAAPGRATRRPADPGVRRALEAAQAAAQIPDHPRLDQVFDVFAEAGSLWIVSEFVTATPLSELLADAPLSPYRAAEIGSDLLTALRALHAHGWTHRNVTPRTVLVCEDGRVVLTGLAAGAAEEALCGYAPVPFPDDEEPSFGPRPAAREDEGAYDDGDDAHDEHDAADGEADGPYEAEYGDAYEDRDGHLIEDLAGDPAEDLAEGQDGGGGAGYGPQAYATEEYEPGPYVAEATGSGDHRAELYGAGPAYATGVPWEPVPAYEPAPVHEPEALPPGGYEAAGSGFGAEADSVSGAPDAQDPDRDQGHDPDRDQDPRPSFYGPEPTGTPYGPGEGAGARPEPPAAPVVPAPATPSAAEVRAARAGAIAAYRAGARAAARLGETGALPVQRQAASTPPADLPAEPPADPPTEPLPTQPPGPSGTSGPSDTSGPPGPPAVYPAPQWWSRTDDDDDDDEDDGDDETGGVYGGTPPPRAYLSGTWSDGPHASRDSSRPVPAGGGPLPALPAGYTAAAPAPVPAPAPGAPTGGVPAYRGPVTRLAAERARQARIAVIGAVTERWAPEQAGPVHEHWRLAPPIGPATDLWALGALLYRAVQGHAPYPEDSAAELVQLVCSEPPAFAEECGPLRPVVESLLHQDPTERPDVEVLSGWLRSLVRSAPEPEAGLGVAAPPSPDATRLPIVRRRGELVRRRRGGGAAGGRHRHAKGAVPRQGRRHEDAHTAHEPLDAQQPPYPYPDETGSGFPSGFRNDFGSAHQDAHQDAHRNDQRHEYRGDHPEDDFREEIPQRAARRPAAPRGSGAPRSLGRILLVLILLLLAGAIAYAVLFMPGEGEGKNPTATPPPAGSTTPPPASTKPASPSATPSAKPSSVPPPTSATAPALDAGYVLRKDTEGFEVGVPRDWRRSPINDAGQVRYTGGDFTLIVVPGRDTVRANGADPMAYQRTKERELQPWRDSSWSGASGLRRIDIGRQAMAVGQFTWQDSTGREVFVRNLALIDRGRYHVVQVIGPENERDKVSEIYDQAVKAYRATR